MIVKIIRARNGCSWKIYAVCTDRKDCQVSDFLLKLPSNFENSRDRLIALLDHVLKDGPRLLPDDICHTIADGIWQFSVGRLRVAWFYDEGKVIICTHGFMKKTKKTEKANIERALKAKELYFTDKERKNLTILNDED